VPHDSSECCRNDLAEATKGVSLYEVQVIFAFAVDVYVLQAFFAETWWLTVALIVTFRWNADKEMVKR
jgi:hypothetical protein